MLWQRIYGMYQLFIFKVWEILQPQVSLQMENIFIWFLVILFLQISRNRYKLLKKRLFHQVLE